LASEEQGLTLVLSRPKPDDLTYAHGDRVVLAIGPEIAPRLRSTTLDIEPRSDGTKDVILVPSPGEGDKEARAKRS
jgi:hypothetical protein